MHTPFDEVITEITARGFHNHRLEDHSGTVSRGILRDLRQLCAPFQEDFAGAKIRESLDFPSPAGRARKLDLVVAESDQAPVPRDLSRMRLCVENKSVITAHRNRTNRYDDLSDLLGVLHQKRPDAILVATVLVGLAERVLNVPDRIKPFVALPEFEERVLPRLSTGDQTLWDDFPHAVSKNRTADPQKTVDKFRQLPTRPPGRTDMVAYDYVLLVPVFVDNVQPARLARENTLGLDLDGEYQEMLDRICRAYKARWHT